MDDLGGTIIFGNTHLSNSYQALYWTILMSYFFQPNPIPSPQEFPMHPSIQNSKTNNQGALSER